MDMDPGLAQHLDRGHDHLNPTLPTTPDRKNPVDKPAQTGSTNTPTTKTDTKPTIRSIRHSQTPHIGGSRVRYTRWTNAQPLEIHAPPISNARTQLSRLRAARLPPGHAVLNPRP